MGWIKSLIILAEFSAPPPDRQWSIVTAGGLPIYYHKERKEIEHVCKGLNRLRIKSQLPPFKIVKGPDHKKFSLLDLWR